MPTYTWNNSAEYAGILNVPDATHKVTVQITEQLSRQRRIQNTVEHLRWRVLRKESCLSAGGQPEIFQGKEVGGLWN